MERVLPHSLEAERALLGAILMSDKAWAQVATLVRPADFYRQAHQILFNAMCQLAQREEAIDYVTLRDVLKRSGYLDDVGGPAYITALTDGQMRTTNVSYYASIVREKARLRAVICEATKLLDDAYNESSESATLVDGAIRRLVETVGAERTGMVDADTAVRGLAEALANGTAAEPMPCGYTDVDKLIGGFLAGDFVVVAARPSVGKTSFALGLAEHIARTCAGRQVPFFSLEMGIDGLAKRLLGWRSGVSMAQAIRGTATFEQYDAINQATGGFVGVPLRIQTSASTLTEIDAWCRRAQQELPLAAVVIDYMQLLASEEEDVAALSRGLKRLARDLGAPVIGLSQLNRAPEGRADKRPHLSDLRGSGALEQDTDLAILLYRPELHQRTPDNDGVTEVIVAKNRDGPTGIVRLYFNKELAQFKDFAPSDEAAT